MFSRRSKHPKPKRVAQRVTDDDHFTADHPINQKMVPIEYDVSRRNVKWIPYPSENGSAHDHYAEDTEDDEGVAVKDPFIRERAAVEYIVLIDFKTTTIFEDKNQFMISLSGFVAEIYERLDTSVAISLQNNSALLYGGTFAPAYLVTVKGMSEYLTPSLNDRDSALLQNHLREAIGVAPDRGLITFEALLDSDIATNGKTLQTEIAILEEGIQRGMRSGYGDSITLQSKLRLAKAMHHPQSPNTFRAHPTNVFRAHYGSDLPTSPYVYEDFGAPPPPPSSRGRSNDQEKLGGQKTLERRRSFGT
ncbi:hypothetical protein BJ878DRAFT_261594 [Calycina marina]|uniref:L-dopachrome isomerase n=1 Tax=Calycina marina TaxID=1763456 RepID=A0A9P7YWY1_9HELO|nr:hypothetical protein BJ878DRAFT_261594 [Calycina marina]